MSPMEPGARIVLAPGDDLVAVARGSAGDLVVEVMPGRDPLSLAQTLAAVGPLAVERAPAARLNVVVRGEGAADADVAAAVAFLSRAPSTTGQVLEVR